MRYQELHRRSIDEPEVFWRQEAGRVHWQQPFDTVLDFSRPPVARWFVGGTTNLCHNAVDRWAATQPDAPALIHLSTELESGGGQAGRAPSHHERSYTYSQLLAEVQTMAAALIELGARRGDRVLIYMPMVPQAVFAMLACARIGAIHCVVFGGFASHSLASRIDDAEPLIVVSADAGLRNGRTIAYKPLLDEAIALSAHKPARVLLVDRGLVPMERVPDRDVDYESLARRHAGAQVPVQWLESAEASYVLHTSGTSGRPKGVQRDTGGYAVALASSMHGIFQGGPGDVFFATSDIGWVVGHSYIVYGPLIAGMATVLYEGTPVRPDAGILWRIVEQYRVNVMFSAPTAVRVLKKQDPSLLHDHDLSSLRALFLAGEPLDAPTSRWISDAIGKPVIDNYWQTETGWPILAIGNGYCDVPMLPRVGSPGVPMPGFDVQLVHEQTGEPVAVGEKGVVTIVPPLPPGCLQTLWRDDARFAQSYFSAIPERQLYSTSDWGRRDADGYHFILGRTDDVINVAGHRLGTREIEESVSSHPAVAECAVVGIADELRGQVAVTCVVPREAVAQATADQRQALQADIMKTVETQLGAVARPARVVLVTMLPKTRSGKVLRRSIQAVFEGRDPGDLPTIEDASALSQLQQALAIQEGR